MTEQDFCYWLQGFFELTQIPQGPGLCLSIEQLECIQRHIKLVQLTKKDSILMLSLNSWVEEAMEEENNSRFVSRMREMIASFFEHVIDPQHPNQEAANKTHHPFHLDKDTLYRC